MVRIRQLTYQNFKNQTMKPIHMLKVLMPFVLIIFFYANTRGGSCPDPSNLSAINVSTSGFTLTWSAGAVGSTFLVEGDSSGFVPGNGNVFPASDTFLVVNTPLVPGDYLDIYVTQLCSGGDTSNQVGPLTFVIPITNDMCADAIELTVQANACSLPTLGSNDGATDSGILPAPSCANYNGGDVWFYSLVPATGTITIETSNAGGITDGGMEVYLGSCGTLIFLECDDDDGPGLLPMISQSGLTPGDTVWIRVWEYGNDVLGDFGICAYHISCADPTVLGTRNVTSSSAELFWTAGGSGNAWEVEYGPTGFTQGAGLLIGGITDTFYNLTPLAPNTSYDFYVREVCGSADTSGFTGPENFITPCVTVVAPYLETFDNGGLIPSCWSTFGAEDWLFDDGSGVGHGGDGGNIVDHTSGTGFLGWVDDSSPHSTGTTLESPLVDVGGLSAPQLSFWLNSDNETFTNVDFSVDIWDGATWNVGVFTSNANTNGWQEFMIDLSVFTLSGPVQARFIVDENNGTDFYDDIAIDDVNFRQAPSCPDPVGLSVGAVTSSSANLSWTSMGTGTEWQVEYGASGFVQGTGTLVTGIIDTFYNLTTLSSNTTYDFYIREVCGVGDTSGYSGPVMFTTLCTAAVAPYLETFDNGGNMPSCWSNFGAEPWLFADGSLSEPGHGGNGGAIVDNTSGTGFFGWVDDSSPHSIGTTLESPLVDVSGLSIPQLSFWLNSDNEGNSNVDFSVDIWDGAAWNVGVLTSDTNTNGWQEFLIDLSALTISGPVQARFIVDENNGTDFYDDIALDDVFFRETPSCDAPVNLSASNETGSSALLTWMSSGTGTEFVVEYGFQGFTLGTGTLITGVSDTFYNLTGLAPASSYSFFVKEVCAVGDTSNSTGPISFSTTCPTQFVAPYFENFESLVDEGNGVLSNCWLGNQTTDPRWEAEDANGANENSTGTGPFWDHTLFSSSGGIYMFMETSSGALGAQAELESPLVDLTTLTNPYFSFYYHMYGADMGELHVDVWDGAVWNDDLIVIIGEQQTAGSDPWREIGASLLAYSGQTIKIRFRGLRGNGFTSDMSLDDVRFDEAPACPNPINISANPVGGDSVNVDWSTANIGAGFIVEYGFAGFTQGTGTIVTGTVGGASPEASVGGLIPQTFYDFYVTEICLNGDTSATLGPVNITTPCATFAAPYFENFETLINEANGQLTNCWVGNQTTDPRWEAEDANGTNENSTGTGPFWDHTLFGTTGGIYMFMETTAGAVGAQAELESPFVDLAGLSNPYFSFYYHMYGAAMGELHVDVWDGTTWNDDLIVVVGQQQTLGSDPWQEIGGSLAAYSGQTIKIRFRGLKGGTTSDMSIDDVLFDEAPACPNPINLNVNLVSGDSVNVDWSSANAGATYILEYGLSGFALGTGTVVTGGISGPSPVASVGGLMPQSDYDFYVTEVCQPGDTTSTLGPIAVATPCATFVAPYFEDFESLVDEDNGILSNCWIGNQTIDPRWEAEDANGANENSTATGPFWDHSLFGTPGGIYMFMETSAGTVGSQAELESPFVDLSGLTDPFFSFYYHMYGADMGELHVDVWDGVVWNDDLIVVVGQQQTAGSDPWVEIGSSLLAYSGQTIKVRFRGLRGVGFTSDMSLDDVRFGEAPTCPNPINLSASLVTGDSVNLDWTTANVGAGFIVEYGLVGFTPGTGTIVTGVVSAVSPLASVGGLMPNSDYQFYVREVCAPGDTTSTVGPVAVGTPCATFVAPYFENFETLSNGDFGVLNNCWEGKQLVDPQWEAEDASGANENSLNTGPFWDNTLFGSSGGIYMFVETSAGVLGASSELESPFVDLSGLAVPYFSFYYHMYGADMGELHVDVWDGAVWNNDLIVIIGQQQTAGSSPWIEAGVSLSAYLGQTIKIRFRGLRGNGFTSDMSIDDVRFDEAPTCPVPINLTTSIVSSDTIHLDWTTANIGAGYIVEYGPLGFTPGTGTTVTGTVSGSSPEAVLMGLAPNTDYSFYLQEVCGIGDSSYLVGPSSFTTPCATFTAPYFEDFETLTNGAFGVLNNCWEGKQLIDPQWEAEDASGANENSLNTGPFWDHTFFGAPGGIYMFMETSSGVTGSPAELESAFVDLSGLTNPYFSYYYHMYGSNMGELHVDVWDGTAWNSDLMVIVGQQQTAGSDAWRWTGASLAPYAGQVVKIRFRGLRGNGLESDMSIDDVRFDEAPPQPINDSCLNAIALTCNSLVSGTTIGATDEAVIDGTTCGTSITSPGVWYTIQGTGGTIVASTCNNADFDTKISVFEGSCDSLVCVGGNDNSALCGTGSSEFSWASNIDSTYYILVHGNLGNIGNFDLTVNTITINIAGLSASYCETDPISTLVGTPSGGVFGGPGIMGSVFDPGSAGIGSHSIFYVYNDTASGCSDTLFQTAVVARQTNVSFAGLGNGYCLSDNSQVALIGIPPGGTFNGPGVSGNSFTPSVAGQGTFDVVYEYSPVDPYFVDTTCTFAPLSGSSTSVALGDDVVSAALPIGFSFNFFGNLYTQFQISSNGFITFNVSNTNSSLGNGTIPDPGGVNDLIALVWDDLQSPTVNYFNTGTAPNRKLVVHFNNSYHFNDVTEVVNGQIILSEGTNEIEIQCIACGSDLNDPTSTQGIENVDGSEGLSTPGRNNTNWSAFNDCVRFIPTTCLGRDTQQVVVSVPPPISAGPDITICEGTSIGLSASGGASYVWSNMDSTQSIFVSPAVDSMFSVVGTDSVGCAGEDSVWVVVAPSPSVSLNDASFCSGGSVLLDAGNPGSTYQWSTGVNVQAITVAQTGVYSVTVINPVNNCQSVESAVILVQPTLDLKLADKEICTGDSVVLDASYAGAVYTWSTGETSQTIIVSTPGEYSVTVVASGGCADSDTIGVSYSLPSVTFTGFQTTYCLGDFPLLITGGSPPDVDNDDYSGPGVFGNTFIPDSAGLGDHTLTYTYTDNNGCSNSADLVVSVEVCSGIETVKLLSDITVYPNPFYDAITIEINSKKDGNLNLRMVDVLGKTVTSEELNLNGGANKLVIHPEEQLSLGIYFVELRVENEVHSFKLIKLK